LYIEEEELGERIARRTSYPKSQISAAFITIVKSPSVIISKVEIKPSRAVLENNSAGQAQFQNHNNFPLSCQGKAENI